MIFDFDKKFLKLGDRMLYFQNIRDFFQGGLFYFSNSENYIPENIRNVFRAVLFRKKYKNFLWKDFDG